MPPDTRLTGRDPVLGILHAAVDAAMGGHGATLLVAGEPGIGKTAVLAAVSHHAEARGARVWWGGCWEGSGVPAYWPWSQVLEAASGDRRSGTAQSGAPPLLTAEASSGEASADEAEAARFALFDAIARFLAAQAARHPVVVVLDDLQWADDSSLRLLEFVTHRVRGHSVLFLGAYRDAEAGPTLRRAIANSQVLRLGGLPRVEVGALMATFLGGSVPAGLVTEVHRRSGGNPLFVRELTQLLHAGGSREAPDWTPPMVPDGIRETLERRLARLSQPCANVLTLAAVAGTELRPEVLRRAVEGGPDLFPLLEEATAARVLVAPDEPLLPYRFTHELYRDTILASLPAPARMRLHRAVAHALESLRDEGVPVPATEIAWHFLAAAAMHDPQVIEAAIQYATEAGREASAQLAYTEACDHYERALRAVELAGEPKPEARLRLLLQLAPARDRAGEGPRAREVFLAATAIARELRDAPGLADAAIGIHRLGAPAGVSHHDNISLLDEADRALGEDATALHARLLASLARDLHHSWEEGNTARARPVAERAVAIARDVDDAGTLAFSLLALHDAGWGPGTAENRLPIVEEMLAAAVSARDRGLVAQATLLRATALLELGDPHGRAELERYCELAEDLGHARGRWGALSRRSVLALIDGRTDESRVLADDAARLGKEIGEVDTLAVYDTLLWELARFRSGRARHAHPRPPLPVADHPSWRAIRLAESGELEAARAVLERFDLTSGLRPGVAASHDPWPLVVTAEAIAAAGTGGQRDKMYQALQPLAGTHVVVGGCAAYAGAVDHYLGLLAASLGRHDEATRHFSTAEAMHHCLGAPLWAELGHNQVRRLEGSNSGTRTAPNVFRREGATWTLAYDGRTIHLSDSKGLRDLAVLLSCPGETVPAVQLRAAGAPVPATGADPVLDRQALRAYRERLAQLEQEIETADTDHDLHRAERARTERDVFVRELSRALGLGGRTRRLGDETERARKTVSIRIRRVIDQIRVHHPGLADHLDASVETGSTCMYRPRPPTPWNL